MEKQTCPRRYEVGQAGDGVDSWQVSEKRNGHEYRTCTYCGSVHPADFIALIKAGTPIEATDKSYKFYVDIPSTNPDRLWVLGASYGRVADGFIPWAELTKEQRKAVKAGGYKKGSAQAFTFAKRTVQFGKFYTHHFQQGYGATFRKLRARKAIAWKYAPYVALYVPNTTDGGEPIVGEGV